ncbi:hypothetical protein DL96DRAFT_16518 [Flagelloscypha sp. PMI_526]|nr:hypothetical protein DL96DRAFT_16518 [Flagelloscypha sp. PMI_526]
MSQPSTLLPAELWDASYFHLAQSATSLKELASYLTIHRLSYYCLKKWLYRSLVIRQLPSDQSGQYLSRIVRAVLEGRSSSWPAEYVKHLYIPYGITTCIQNNISILVRCSNITRLVCWLDAHDDPALARAINSLQFLKVLEVNIRHFAFLLEAEWACSRPQWRPHLTHLSLLVWDHLRDDVQSWTGTRLSLEGFTSLKHVALNSSSPDKFCLPLLQTSPASLQSLIVFHKALDREAHQNPDIFIQRVFPLSGDDSRLLFFREANDYKLVNASAIALRECPLANDGPLDDWGQTPCAGDGVSLSLWNWAEDARKEGRRVFGRPVPMILCPQ